MSLGKTPPRFTEQLDNLDNLFAPAQRMRCVCDTKIGDVCVL